MTFYMKDRIRFSKINHWVLEKGDITIVLKTTQGNDHNIQTKPNKTTTNEQHENGPHQNR